MPKFQVIVYQRASHSAATTIEAPDAAAAEAQALQAAEDGSLDMTECADSFDSPHYAVTYTLDAAGEIIQPAARVYDPED